jgi:hypothetical protein
MECSTAENHWLNAERIVKKYTVDGDDLECFRSRLSTREVIEFGENSK